MKRGKYKISFIAKQKCFKISLHVRKGQKNIKGGNQNIKDFYKIEI